MEQGGITLPQNLLHIVQQVFAGRRNLLAGGHVLDGEHAGSHLALASHDHHRYIIAVGIFELLLEFGGIGI